MRIAHVTPTYLPATRYGGPIYSVHGLCAGLVRAGDEVHVFTTRVDGPGNSPVPVGVPVERDGVHVWYFDSKLLRRLYWSASMWSRMREALPQFDVVHVHSLFLWPPAAAARIALDADRPVVMAPRGMLVRELIREHGYVRKMVWLNLVDRAALRRATMLHVTSPLELVEAQRMGFELPPACIVPNGTDACLAFETSAVSPRIRRIREGDPYALFLGRLHPKKGLERLLEALEGTRVRVVLCGPNEANYAASLRASVRRRRLEQDVVFEDPVAGADKSALLDGARALVLPSTNENFGNVVVEAMAAGRPVVTNSSVGAAWLVTQARCGFVTDSPAELRDAVLRLMADEGLSASLGENGRSYATEHLSWDSVARQMRLHYDSLVSGRRAQ